MTETAALAATNPVTADTEQTLSTQDRDSQANRLIRNYTLGAMGVGVVPLPLVDLALAFGLQLKLIHDLAKLYDVPFKKEWARSAISSLLGGALPLASTPTMTAGLGMSLGKLIPVGGHVLSTSSLVILNGAATYALGKVFMQHFAAGGTFLTFKPENVREYFAEQFQQGKQVASDLKSKEQA